MMEKCRKMSNYGLLLYLILEDGLLDYKEYLEGEKLGPFDMRREEWKSWKVVNSVWWVAIGETRFNHFRLICGGDKDAANLLMPIVLSNRGEFPHFPETSINQADANSHFCRLVQQVHNDRYV
jgi:hypothetical protein